MLLEDPTWQTEVLEAPGPVVVDFWAAACRRCELMAPVIEALARDFKVCKVNVDTNRSLAELYGIDSVPALLIFNKGQVVARHEGMTQEAALRTALAALARQ
jgi:thioredoxin 1